MDFERRKEMSVSKREMMTTWDATCEMAIWCGLGRCSRCSCPAFQGRGNICEYCSHHYDEHGTSPFRGATLLPSMAMS